MLVSLKQILTHLTSNTIFPKTLVAITQQGIVKMNTIGPMIAASAKLGMNYANRLLKDVSPEIFCSFAKPSGTPIESNHPAFIYGHLSLYAPRIVAELGADASNIQPSERFIKLFSKDAKCANDETCDFHPPMDEILDAFRTGHEAAIQALEAAEDELFKQNNPNEAMQKLFPTIGAMHAFYVGGHLMMHMGQMSAWRRMMGLGAA